MQNEIGIYFEQTFTSFFSKRLHELVQQRTEQGPNLMLSLTDLQRQMDDLFKNHIPRKIYISTLIGIIGRFYCALWVGQESLGKSELGLKLYLLIFSIWVEGETHQMQGGELFGTGCQVQLDKVINYFRLVCQMESDFAFQLFFEELFGCIKHGTNAFRQRLLRIFRKCEIDRASFLSYLKPSCLFKQEIGIKLEQYESEQNSLNTEVPREKERKIQKQSIIKKQVYSPMNSGKSETTTDFTALRIAQLMKRRESPVGRTLYMAHPMKYIKKQKQKVKKVYHYVDSSVEVLE